MITIRSASAQPVPVSGDLTITRPGVTLLRIALSGEVGFEPGSDGSQFVAGSARMFHVHGASDITISDSVFNGQGKTRMNWIWDSNGAPARRVRVLRNTIRNFFTSTASDHTEGLYIGYSEDVLVEGNHFVDNGNTGHIFLTWWGDRMTTSDYPRRTCVRGNTFGARKGAWVDVDMRKEIPLSSGIYIDPAQGASVARAEFLRPCPA
jgi:hypothetical protein